MAGNLWTKGLDSELKAKDLQLPGKAGFLLQEEF